MEALLHRPPLIPRRAGSLLSKPGTERAIKAFFGGNALVAVVVLALHYRALRPALPDRSRGSLGAGLRSRVFSYGASVTGMSALDLIVWQRSEVVFLGVFRDSREVAF